MKTKRWVVILAVILSVVIFSGFTLLYEKRAAEIEQYEEAENVVNSFAENITGNDKTIQTIGYSDIFSLSNTLNLSTDSDFVGAIDKSSDTVLYFLDPFGIVYENCSFESAGLSKDLLSGIGTHIITLRDSNRYIVFAKDISTKSFGDITVFYLSEEDQNFYPEYVFCFIFVFIFIAIVVACYTLYLKADRLRHDQKEDYDKKMRNRILLLIAGCGLFFFLLTFYLSNLTGIKLIRDIFDFQTDIVNSTLTSSLEINRNESELLAENGIASAKSAAESFEKNAEKILNKDSSQRFIYYEVCDEDGTSRTVNDTLGNPTVSIASSSYLAQSCRDSGIEEICIYDCNGRIIASSTPSWNGSLSNDNFRKTLFRQTDSSVDESDGYITIGVPVSLYVKPVDGETVFCSSSDGEASLEYGLLLAKTPCPPEHISYYDCFKDTIKDLETIIYCKIVMVQVNNDDDSVQILYKPEEFKDADLEQLGLTHPNCFKGDYLSAVKLSDSKYLLKCENSGLDVVDGSDGSYYYAYYTDEDTIGGTSMFLRAYIPFTVFAMLLLGLLALAISRMSNNDALVIDGGDITLAPEISDEDADVKFRKMSPEQKLYSVIRICLRIMIALIILYGVYCIATDNKFSIFWHVLYGNWTRGVNFISITACIICFLFVFAGFFVIGKVLDFLSKNLSTKAQTFCRLAVSIIKYIGVLFCIFDSLYLFGMDVKTVLTSLGAFSILIGLGAQSLIKDILAGFFLLIEGQFKIGDIITIGGYTGRVKEIGLRSTKCENRSGDITIFSNSSINQVENRSKKLSRAFTDSPLSMATPLNEFEDILKKEIPDMEERLKDLIIGNISYDGVVSFDSRFKIYTVRVSAHCRELDRGKVKHALSKEILSICNKYKLV